MENNLRLYDNCGTMAGYKKHRYYFTPICEDCRTASRENKRAIRAANPERTKKENKEGHIKRREKVLERNRLFRKNNPEYVKEYADKYRATHKEEREEYRLSNLEKFRSYARKRKAWKLNNGFEPYTEEQVFELYGKDCHICNTPIDFTASKKVGVGNWRVGLHMDHLIPLSKGGSDTIDNVRPSHGECNLVKNAKVLQEAKDVE
jgi:5-methylcytosine-specific restriction endonuclease McrA